MPAIPTLSPGAIDVLMDYHWPGNIREFGNIVERALILHPTGPLSFEHLNLSDNKKGPIPQHSEHTAVTDNLDEAMSNHIRRVLEKTDSKIHGKGGAAELLGIHANTLRNRMNKLGIAYGRKGKGEPD